MSLRDAARPRSVRSQGREGSRGLKILITCKRVASHLRNSFVNAFVTSTSLLSSWLSRMNV
jgi:hypothetical protein